MYMLTAPTTCLCICSDRALTHVRLDAAQHPKLTSAMFVLLVVITGHAHKQRRQDVQGLTDAAYCCTESLQRAHTAFQHMVTWLLCVEGWTCACRMTFDMTSYMKDCKRLHPDFFPEQPFYPKVDVHFSISSCQVMQAHAELYSLMCFIGTWLIFCISCYTNHAQLDHSCTVGNVTC